MNCANVMHLFAIGVYTQDVISRWSLLKLEQKRRKARTDDRQGSLDKIIKCDGDGGEKVRPRLNGEKLSRVEESPTHPNYPGRANFSYTFPYKTRRTLYIKNVGSTRRVTRFAK